MLNVKEVAKREPKPTGRSQQQRESLSLTPKQEIKGMFQISRVDVERIMASKPSMGRKK
jgi:hypothetical protein